jgi:hypothetical protein
VISVGASADKLDENLAGSFSNYGKKNVDVFAPGVKVTSVEIWMLNLTPPMAPALHRQLQRV